MWNTGKVIDLKGIVPEPSFSVTQDFKNGNTNDIISVVMRNDKEAATAAHLTELAKYFQCDSPYDTCRKIYDNIKHNVKYVADEAGHEICKLPNALIYFKKGDCKSLSSAIAECLRRVHGGKIKCGVFFIYESGRKIIRA